MSRAALIERKFRDLKDSENGDYDFSYMYSGMWENLTFGWDELLKAERVLLVSEAGSGKTFECKAKNRQLQKAGAASFYFEVNSLAANTVDHLLPPDEHRRFQNWAHSGTERAIFFLDAHDELRLTTRSFSDALSNLSSAIREYLRRVTIVFTTRPVPIDRKLILEWLPIPSPDKLTPSAHSFADLMIGRNSDEEVDKPDHPPIRQVTLVSLSHEQRRDFICGQGVQDPDALLDHLRELDADELSRRPQDLIEICSDWVSRRKVGTYRERVQSNVWTKIEPSRDRVERVELSREDAFEGVTRIALAALLTRKLIICHNAASENAGESADALDPTKILIDWSVEKQKVILERPIFVHASYGRVRFHHRTVLEYLAAQRLKTLIAQGVPTRRVKRLLFTETAFGTSIVRPSLAPVAAWLACDNDEILSEVIDRDPAVLFQDADPSHLMPGRRADVLTKFVGRYGPGTRRGQRVPRVQINRFADSTLADDIIRLWNLGIENSEVREVLLGLVKAARITQCADLAHGCVCDRQRTNNERLLALEALIELCDPRISSIVDTIETDRTMWPDDIAGLALHHLFPKHIAVEQMLRILGRIRGRLKGTDALSFYLPNSVKVVDVTAKIVEDLREGVMGLVIADLAWKENKHPQLRTSRFDLVPLLMACCVRLIATKNCGDDWIASAALCIRLSAGSLRADGLTKDLQAALRHLRPDQRQIGFWAEFSLISHVHQFDDEGHALFEAQSHGAVGIDFERDLGWVRRHASDVYFPIFKRKMMLWALIQYCTSSRYKRLESLLEIRSLVEDNEDLSLLVDRYLEPEPVNPTMLAIDEELKRYQTESEQRAQDAHRNWVNFWNDVKHDHERMFGDERRYLTAWRLWDAMRRVKAASETKEWNRQFLEEQFSKEIADRLRTTLMAEWRAISPSLPSERAPEDQNTYPWEWQFGLAGIYAESENHRWVQDLTTKELELACRYALVQLNGFPAWLEHLVTERPLQTDAILGHELYLSLNTAMKDGSNCFMLQMVRHSTDKIRSFFCERVVSWFDEAIPSPVNGANRPKVYNLATAIEVMLESDVPWHRERVITSAIAYLSEELTDAESRIWLSALLRLKPEVAIDLLEAQPMGSNRAIAIFAHVFQREHGGVGVNLHSPQFTPALLLRLLRLAYRYVRPEDDEVHHGPYSPNMRDDAERNRSEIFGALMATSGPDGWAAKLELMRDPIFSNLKDRIYALALDKAAREADNGPLTESEFVELDRSGEIAPRSSAEMMTIIRDRIEGIGELLRRDVSPREMWANIDREVLLRRAIARELEAHRRNIYRVEQESVTSDEKETDIRLRSTSSNQQGVIELKIGGNWSGPDLFDSLQNQLFGKYMAADECRAGCLLITTNDDKKWQHPDTRKNLSFAELIEELRFTTQQLVERSGGNAHLAVYGLDLRPPAEK